MDLGTHFATAANRIELYEDEQTVSTHAPPPGWGPGSAETPLAVFREVWPRLDSIPSESLLVGYHGRMSGNDGAEGLFIFPTFKALLRLTGSLWSGEPDYNRVLRFIHATMKEVRPDFVDWVKSRQLGKGFERPREETWQRLMAHQNGLEGDFDVLPGATGVLYRGASDRRARALMKRTANQIGMSSIESGAILIADPARLVAYENLAIGCVGSERVQYLGGDFVFAPRWCFRDGGLKYRSYDIECYHPWSGAGCFFLPEAI